MLFIAVIRVRRAEFETQLFKIAESRVSHFATQTRIDFRIINI